MTQTTTQNELRILLLEDSPDDAELIGNELRKARMNFTSKRVESRESFGYSLDDFLPDIVLSDFNLPSFSGLAALNMLLRSYPETPLIIVTGALSDREAVELLQAGAKDYVLKDRLARLVPAIKHALLVAQKAKAIKLAEAQLLEKTQLLEKSNQFFTTLAQISPVGIFRTDKRGGCTYFNECWSLITGITSDKALGAGWAHAVHPDDREKVEQAWYTSAQAHNNFIMEYRIQRPNGVTRRVLGQASAERDAAGEVLGYVGTITDITQSKQDEEELQRFFNLTPDLVCIATTDGHFQKINSAWQDTIGYTEREILEKPFLDFIHPDDRDATMKEVERQLAGETTIQFTNRYRCKDGSYKWLEWKATPAVDKKLLFAAARDITERKQAEDNLRNSEVRYRSLFENMLEGFAYCKMQYDNLGRPVDFVYLDVNEAFMRLTGLKNVVGKPVSEVIPGIKEQNPELIERYGRVASTGVPEIFDIDLKLLSKWFSFSVYGAEKGYFVAVFDDITERKLNEAKIQRLTELYAALSQCNQAIVHCTGENDLFLQVCRNAVQFGGFRMAWIAIVDPDTRIVRPVASFGSGAGEYLQDIEISADAASPFGRGPTGTAIRENQPVWCQDFQNDPSTAPWHERGARFGWGSSTALPLHRNGIVIGAFSIYSNETNAFDEAARDLLLEMASDISYALDNFARETERRQIEKALLETQKLLDDTQQISKLGGWKYDCATRHVTWTDEVYRIYGVGKDYDPSDPGNDIKFYSPEDQQTIEHAFNKAGNEGESYDLELKLVRLNGENIWVRTIGNPTVENGKVVGVIGNIVDITERKQAEKKLYQLSRDFILFLENTTDFIYFKDENSRFRFCSQTLANITGYASWRDMIGKHDMEVFPKDTAQIYHEEELPIFREGKPLLNKIDPYYDAQGIEGWVSTNKWPVFDDEGKKVVGIFGISRDVTVNKQAEKAIQTTSQYTRSLIEASLDPLVTISAEGKITDVNTATENVTGVERAGLIGSDFADYFTESEKAREGYQQVFSQGFVTDYPLAIRHVSGKITDVLYNASVYRDSNGNVLGVFAAARDITARKKFEEELLRSNTELEQFSYAVSHDMRQPLRMISSYLQLLERSLERQLDGEKRDYFNFAIDGAKRIDQMLVALLEYSRVGRMGEPLTWIDSRAVLDEALLFLQPAIAEAQAKLAISGDWTRIFASHDEVLRLLQNLIGNAAKYRIAGRIPEITVSSEMVKNEWHLCVADNGVGIIPGQINRLFKVFQRLHSRDAYEGTGIGLALCRKIAEHHKGRIWAESAGEGQGSKFCVALPCGG